MCARLQVAGEGDVRERGSGPAATPEQLLADRRHVSLLRVERGVHDELLGGAELPAQPLHLVSDRGGGAAPQAGALQTRVRAVYAAVRAAPRRLHAGGAIPPGAGETPAIPAGRQTLPRPSSGRSTMPCRKMGLDEQSRSDLAVADDAVAGEQRAADLAGEDRERRAAEDDPRLRRCRAHRVRDKRVPVRVGACVRPGGVVGIAQREPDRVGAPGLQLGPQRREGPPVEARVKDAGRPPAASTAPAT